MPKKFEVAYDYSASVDGLEEENKFLRQSVHGLERELEKFRKAPLIACEVREIIKDKALIRLQNGNEFLVEIADDCGPLRAGDGVLAEQKNLTVVSKFAATKRFDVEQFVILEKPNVTWNQIGGLGEQIREIKEVIELPLKKPYMFEKVGIEPPRGILLHGPPGTGKTLLAKAVARSTNATFIQIVGSELVQKFIGDGAKLVKEVFQLAREKAPTIIFIDELDAIAATRIEVGTSGEREVQRTFMQLLAEIDGFKPLDNIKIIGCTNRKDILDQAVIRPGRLDRHIHVPMPNFDGCKEIFKIHIRNMRLENAIANNVAQSLGGVSGAEIRAIVTEAGYFAIRSKREKVVEEDFFNAINKLQVDEEGEDHHRMFG